MRYAEQLSEEEESYNEWVSKNLSFINQHKQSIAVMKILYLEGFRAGLRKKQNINAMEQLQK